MVNTRHNRELSKTKMIILFPQHPPRNVKKKSLDSIFYKIKCSFRNKKEHQLFYFIFLFYLFYPIESMIESYTMYYILLCTYSYIQHYIATNNSHTQLNDYYRKIIFWKIANFRNICLLIWIVPK